MGGRERDIDMYLHAKVLAYKCMYLTAPQPTQEAHGTSTYPGSPRHLNLPRKPTAPQPTQEAALNHLLQHTNISTSHPVDQ